jgi:hypothetical protein
LAIQLVVDLEGENILEYSISLGHNNDKGQYNLGLKSYLTKNNFVVLVDGGYSNTDPNLLRAEHLGEKNSKTFNGFRSVVETAFAFLGFFKFTSTRVRVQDPILHSVILENIILLVNQKIQESPLRPNMKDYLVKNSSDLIKKLLNLKKKE